MVVSDQVVLCKAALLFAVTRWIVSFALGMLTSSTLPLFSSSDSSSSSSSSCCSTPSSSSSAKLKIVRENLTLTTLENIEHRDDDLSCAVCLNRMRKKSQVWELRNCNHVFHKQCLERWLCYDDKLTCPLCRASLVPAGSGSGSADSLPERPSWAVEKMLYLFGDDLLP